MLMNFTCHGFVLKKLSVTTAVAATALIAAGASEDNAKWIAYPGDNALHVASELQVRRLSNAQAYPPFWPAYAAHPGVHFRKKVKLAKPVPAKIEAKGVYRIYCLGPAGVKDGAAVFPAGEYEIWANCFSQGEPPALKITGEGVDTDESWTADWGGGPLPAETFTDDPAASPLKIEPRAFKSIEKDGDGLFADLGREDFGFLTLGDIKGEGLVRILYGESEPEARERVLEDMEAWEWVRVKPGELRLPTSRGWRYVSVRPEPGVSVGSLKFEREYYPLPADGAFRCSDERLNEIWRVSQYTLATTMREIPVEAAKRDRWTWSGDAVQSFLMNYYLFGAAKPVRDALWYLRGGDPVVKNLNHIMDYSFYWFIAVEDYYRFTGDRRFLEQVYPRAKTLMDFIISRLDREGRPDEKAGDWIFIDWAPEELHNYGGVTSFETMLLARAFEALAACGEVCGDKATDAYRVRAAKLRAWVKPTFWNEAKGGLMHLRKHDGTLDGQFTRYPNIFGLFYGYFDQRETKRVIDEVINNDKVMAIQTPYMRFYELEALAREGRRADVLKEIRSYWGAMLDRGATTFWELYNPKESGMQHYAMYGRKFAKSLCHAWGASPAYLLGRYYLGVEPVKPGFAEYVVQPDAAGLAWMEGAVPTPTGAVKVRVKGDKVSVTGNGGKGVLKWRGREYPIAPRDTVSAGE